VQYRSTIDEAVAAARRRERTDPEEAGA
jgi:hypothetical protein